MNEQHPLIQRHVLLFEKACIYGVTKGGPRLVLSWTQLEKVISYFIAHGSQHVGRRAIRNQQS